MVIKQILTRNAYGLRGQALSILAVGTISFIFAAMSTIAFAKFHTGFPLVAMLLAAVAIVFFAILLYELWQATDHYIAVCDALDDDDTAHLDQHAA